tara:strand:+ start:55 stop:453 length:399 start_codon:yes stop_codon:yes gene_type:complete
MTPPKTVPRLDQPCFLVICRDGPDSAAPRVEHLKAHLDHVEKHWERYITAGPIRDPGEEALVGSIFLVLADSLEDAQTLMNGDPYLTCGMYESIEYKEFSNAIGRFMGGKTWESAEAVAHLAAGGPTKLTAG